MLVRRAPSQSRRRRHEYAAGSIIISCEVRKEKKAGSPCQACVGLPVLCGAARPPRSSRSLAGERCGARPSALSPLTGLRRDPRASAAFPQRCGSVVDAAPPVFGGASCWRRNSLQPRWKPQTAARASWSARTHETGFVSCYAASHVLLSVKKGARPSIRLRSSAPKKSKDSRRTLPLTRPYMSEGPLRRSETRSIFFKIFFGIPSAPAGSPSTLLVLQMRRAFV